LELREEFQKCRIMPISRIPWHTKHLLLKIGLTVASLYTYTLPFKN
jgi:hypothetical protein